MKICKAVFPLLLLCAAAYGQTQDLGMGAFANERGAILMAVDAALVDFQMDRPYVMFVVYLAAKNGNQNIVVSRDTIALVYQGQEYTMPSFKELRENYKGEIRDVDFYRHLGKEGVISSWIKQYNFARKADFFPANTMRSSVALDEASLSNTMGFRTKVYFKNPGFKKGDTMTFRVWAKNDPKLNGDVEVVLK